jgi:hypothetical protein
MRARRRTGRRWGGQRLDDESERRTACDVKREVGSDVDPGQADEGGGAEDDGAAGFAEAGEGGGAQGDGHAGVPGQVPEPGGFAAADVRPLNQGRRPGPTHYVLEDLGHCPGAGAAHQEPPGDFTVPGQPCHACRSGGSTQGPKLHDGPGRRVKRSGQAVYRPECGGLTLADVIPAHGDGRDEQGGRSGSEPDRGIG